MARKQKAPDAGPSKAYLLSFGDTMTALLAFFIVLNSLATEQTGANLYDGTGSFVNAFAKSGAPGSNPSNRSRDMMQMTAPAPIYALAKNLDKNESDENVGPDDTDSQDKIQDRDTEQFQKFLHELDQVFGLKSHPAIKNQIVFDSFVPFDREDGSLSDHALQLAAEILPKHRNDSGLQLELILWAPMPSKKAIDRLLPKTIQAKKELEKAFWIKPQETKRIRYVVKPWLFTDAKRPILSFVVLESDWREER